LDRGENDQACGKVTLCLDLTPEDLSEHMSDIYKQSWHHLALLACPRPACTPTHLPPLLALHDPAEKMRYHGREFKMAHSLMPCARKWMRHTWARRNRGSQGQNLVNGVKSL
jgi:hypothetical protein